MLGEVAELAEVARHLEVTRSLTTPDVYRR